MEVFKIIPDESIDCVVSDVPYKIISWGVRIINQWDECSWVLQKRDYSKTDPKWCLNIWRIVVSDWTACSNKWLKKDQTNIPSAVKDWKMFEHNDIEFQERLPELYRVLKKGTHCYLMINGRNLKDLQTDAEKVWFEYQNLLIRDKGNVTPNKYYMQWVEFILMLSKRPAKNINNMWEKNIFKIPNIIWKKQHPTEKPIELMEILIRNSTNEWDIVLDPFCWTWATCVASQKLNRKYIGIEIDSQYSTIAEEKLLFI